MTHQERQVLEQTAQLTLDLSSLVARLMRHSTAARLMLTEPSEQRFVYESHFSNSQEQEIEQPRQQILESATVLDGLLRTLKGQN